MRLAAPEHLRALTGGQDFRKRIELSLFHGGRIRHSKFLPNFRVLAVAMGVSSPLRTKEIEYARNRPCRLAEVYLGPQKFARVPAFSALGVLPPYTEK